MLNAMPPPGHESEVRSEVRSEERFFTASQRFDRLYSTEKLSELKSALFAALAENGYDMRPYDPWGLSFIKRSLPNTPFREEPFMLNACQWQNNPDEQVFAIGLRITVRTNVNYGTEIKNIVQAIFRRFFDSNIKAEIIGDCEIYTFAAEI